MINCDGATMTAPFEANLKLDAARGFLVPSSRYKLYTQFSKATEVRHREFVTYTVTSSLKI
jgi:hypothetical protein